MRFDVPSTAAYTQVTVQFDNSNFDALRNIAIAVYRINGDLVFPFDTTGLSPTVCNALSATQLDYIACSNSVYSGSESVTHQVFAGHSYLVRVMNVHDEEKPRARTGRIRVFPFAACTAGANLVVDGDFDGWPDVERGALDTAPDNNNETATAGNLFDDQRNDDILRIPNVTEASAYPNNLDGIDPTQRINGVARFATDYGFLKDRTNNGNLPDAGSLNDPNRETYTRFTSQQYELNPEGLYLVRQSPWTVKGDWFCFGAGFSGYGGRLGGGEPQQAYCASGAGGFENEPCQIINLGGVNTIGNYNPVDGIGGIDRPAAFPNPSTTVGDPNFMIINGSYNPDSNLPPGKIWCQTAQLPSAGTVGYYIFTVWAQNMISAGRNLDVPQLRMSVCDMQNPATGLFETATDISGGFNRLTRLPGVTDPNISQVLLPGEVVGQVRHIPEPPTNRLAALVNTGPRPAYGAAAPCNLPAESRDARLKVLGSSFLITEAPDNWVVLRCVYRAPREVTEANICIENLSLTQNGNDIGIDRIGFQQCEGADAETFDRLLKGDPCELAQDGARLGVLLPAQVFDFQGRLMGNKVFLTWLAMGESNTNYELQRSVDGEHFSTISTIDGKGTADGYANYDYIDTNLPEGVSVLYYRLKIITNGYTNMGYVIDVPLTALEDLNMKLVPNPTSNGSEVEVRFNVPKGYAQITVTDMLGGRLYNQMIKTIEGDNTVVLKTAGMQRGLYVVRVVHGGRAVAKKLVVN
jgi:hypothetical protein